MVVLVLVCMSSSAMNAVSSTLGLMILNGMAFSGIAVLAATKHLKVLRYVCEVYVFYSQILFSFGATTSPGIGSGIKCAAQIAVLALLFTNISTNPNIPTASSILIVLVLFVSLTFTFVLHTILPYESVLGFYAAVIYSLGWCVYMVNGSFKSLLVRNI
ncbi:hypothetical protein GGI21_000053 [Coemansia aciculifera]|nr:hypothetical protein GGI21_000053 [Coemansia aciculifera]